MSDKKFSSFYKLNEEEINKLKEEVSGDNVRNSAPVNSTLKWTEYSAPKKVDLSSLSWTEYSAPERIDSPAPKRTEYSAPQGVDSPTPKRTKYSAPKAKKKFATKEDIVIVVIFGIMTSISAFGTIKDFKNKSIVSEPDTKTEITTENIISETQPATEEIKQSDDEFYGNLINDIEYWFLDTSEEENNVSATLYYSDSNNIKFDIEDVGSDASYDENYVQGYYDDINLLKDKFYHIEFDYYSSENLECLLFIIADDCAYQFIELNSTEEVQHCSLYFSSPVSTDEAFIMFDCENELKNSPYSIVFEDISLSRCDEYEDFDNSDVIELGYYDEDGNYHKYED